MAVQGRALDRYKLRRSGSVYEHDRDFRDNEMFGPLTPTTFKKPVIHQLPPEGCLLVERVMQDHLKITRPDGSYNMLKWDGTETFNRLVLNEGIPEYKLDKVLNYVWTFHASYVSVEQSD